MCVCVCVTKFCIESVCVCLCECVCEREFCIESVCVCICVREFCNESVCVCACVCVWMQGRLAWAGLGSAGLSIRSALCRPACQNPEGKRLQSKWRNSGINHKSVPTTRGRRSENF